MKLRDVTEEDLLPLFEQQADPVAYRMAAFPPRDREAFLAHWRTRVLGDAGGRKQTIVVDGQVAGHVVSWTQDGRRLVGYWVGRAFWGRGVGSAALLAFLSHEPLRPLFASVAAHNLGSIRVLEKSGFHLVSTQLVDGGEDRLYRLD